MAVAVSLLLSGTVNAAAAQRPEPDVLSRVDHLVYATPDLARGIAEIEALLGVRAALGGQHPGRGTHNALIALGPAAYLEIIAPDPGQTVRPRVFGLDTLKSSTLVSWAAKGSDLDSLHLTAARNGIPVGAVGSGSRQRTDGARLSWRFTEPGAAGADCVIPFFIDWGKSDHPARTAPAGATLVALRAEHPNAATMQRQLQQLGLDLRVDRAPRPALVAVIEGPLGRVELR
jgi:hypothetical protein